MDEAFLKTNAEVEIESNYSDCDHQQQGQNVKISKKSSNKNEKISNKEETKQYKDESEEPFIIENKDKYLFIKEQSLTEKSEQKNEEPELDKILNKAGYKWLHVKMFLFVCSVLVIDGFHLTFFSSMIIPLTAYYGFSEMHLMMLPGVIFIGNACSSLIISNIKSLFSRKSMIYIGVFGSLFFYVLMIAVRDIIVFTICRFFIGATVAISTACSLGILTEYLPNHRRGFILSTVWCGYTMGQFFMILFMVEFMPNLEVEKTFTTLIYSLIILIVSCIITILVLEDSPRSLILNKNEEKAFKILEDISECAIDNSLREKIIHQVNAGSNQQTTGSLLDIFNAKYFKVTTLLSIIRGSHALINFGILAVSTLTLEFLSKDQHNSVGPYKSNNHEVLENEVLVIFFILVSCFLPGFLTEMKYFGRKFSMLVNYFLSFIFMALVIIFPSNFSAFFGLSLFFSSITSIINHTYCLEIYNTKIRDVALGYLFAFRRIGGFLAQIVFIYLDKIDHWIPYYLTAGLLLMNTFLTWLLEKETYNTSIE